MLGLGLMAAALRVPGHALDSEGAPFSSPGCRNGSCVGIPRVMKLNQYWGSVGGDGHGKCSCGAESDHLASGAARRAWHREHKRQVAEEANA